MAGTPSQPDALRVRRVGWILVLVVLSVYGGLAITVDFPRAAVGIQSDEATYYLMGHSLAEDGDLVYKREDLDRGYREFTSGPAGIFLKRGTDVTGVGLTGAPPFIAFPGRPDADGSRLYFGKAYVYPLFAAPFVRLLGTNGFLVLNALLLAMAVGLGYAFVAARSGPVIGALIGGAFALASVVPVYFVWITPELFNFSFGVLAYFLWLYKHVRGGDDGSARGWLMRPASDAWAAAVIGLLTFSKVTNALMLAPLALWLLWQREWRRLALVIGAWGIVTAVFFGANVAVSGEWNYQGGDRATCYGTYPFQEPGRGLDVCAERARNESLWDIIFDREVFWSNLRANAMYFFVGRSSGMLPYFFPGLFAIAAFVVAVAWRRAFAWQWLVLLGLFLQMATFVVTLPYSYFGGGGAVGNRYFMGAYGVALFLLPAVRSVWVALVPWAIGSLFMAPLILNPFQTSIRPGDHIGAGLFRLLPVELTNTNTLPIATDGSRIRIWYGETPQNPGFQIYYLDANSYLAEADKLSFWIRGRSTAQLLIKTDKPYSRMQVRVTAGPVASSSTIALGGRAVDLDVGPGQSAITQIDLGPGFPYKENRDTPAYIWVMSVSSTSGFVPKMFDPVSADVRYLGVRVEPLIVK